MRRISWDPSDARRVVQEVTSCFRRHAPVVLPTDTLYGLSCPLNDNDAIHRIFELKRRPEELTLPVAVGSLEAISEVAEVDGRALQIAGKLLPGPVTVVLRARAGLPREVIREGTVAVRVPKHPIFHHLTKEAGPLALTSANVHGNRPVASFNDAIDEFGDEDLLMVEDDGSISGEASTIIDLIRDSTPVLRQGKVKIPHPMG